MPVLKIRDENGNFIPITTIQGEPGKSAYEQAVEGGYQGTEEEFIAILGGLSAYSIGTISEVDENHCDDYNNPHKVTASQVGALPISGGNMENAITWNQGKTSIVGQPDGNFIVRNMKLSDNGHDDFLAFHNELALENMLRVYRDGVPYAVYGHHNKPNASDVGAIPSTIGSSGSTIKIDIGNHIYVHDKYDVEVPEMPVVSNFTHYITINASGKVVAALSIPIDYTNKAFYYAYQDKSWHEIVDERPTRATYQGNGDDAERTIEVGGTGYLAIISSSRGMAFLSSNGGSYQEFGSTANGTYVINKANYTNGVITLSSASPYVNGSGITYYVTTL